MSTIARGSVLSDRVAALKPSSTLAVSARVNALKAQGVDVIGFGAGEPDFDTPANIKQAAIDALLAGKTRYTPTPGPMEARQAIAAKLTRENGIDCKPEHIIITVGAKHAMYMAMQALVNPGDEVIILTPAWVSYRPMIELAGGVPVEVPGAIERGFKVTPEQIDAAITPATVAIVINSPSNPCGIAYTPGELRAIAAVLERHPHVTIITDEIYERLRYDGERHLSLGSLSALTERVVTINGLSKAYAMTGWRIGYLCAPGQGGRLIKAVSSLQDQLTSNITSFSYAAVVEALTNGDAAVIAMRDAFARRAALMHDLVAAMPMLRCPKPTGAFYVFPDVRAYLGRVSPAGRRLESACDFAEALLEEARVAVVPGEDFGRCARSHVRLSFACGESQIREGCGRIRGWLERFQ